MDNTIPKCPRCANGGSVKRVTHVNSENELSPQPGHVRTSEVFQCACGWTMVRTVPQARPT